MRFFFSFAYLIVFGVGLRSLLLPTPAGAGTDQTESDEKKMELAHFGALHTRKVSPQSMRQKRRRETTTTILFIFFGSHLSSSKTEKRNMEEFREFVHEREARTWRHVLGRRIRRLFLWVTCSSIFLFFVSLAGIILTLTSCSEKACFRAGIGVSSVLVVLAACDFMSLTLFLRSCTIKETLWCSNFWAFFGCCRSSHEEQELNIKDYKIFLEKKLSYISIDATSSTDFLIQVDELIKENHAMFKNQKHIHALLQTHVHDALVALVWDYTCSPS